MKHNKFSGLPVLNSTLSLSLPLTLRLHKTPNPYPEMETLNPNKENTNPTYKGLQDNKYIPRNTLEPQPLRRTHQFQRRERETTASAAGRRTTLTPLTPLLPLSSRSFTEQSVGLAK